MLTTLLPGNTSRAFGEVYIKNNLDDVEPDIVLVQDARKEALHDEDEVKLDPAQLLGLYDFITENLEQIRKATLTVVKDPVVGDVYYGVNSEMNHEVVAIFRRNGTDYVTFSTLNGFMTIRREQFTDGRFRHTSRRAS